LFSDYFLDLAERGVLAEDYFSLFVRDVAFDETLID
jgi:hypothetical protein